MAAACSRGSAASKRLLHSPNPSIPPLPAAGRCIHRPAVAAAARVGLCSSLCGGLARRPPGAGGHWLHRRRRLGCCPAAAECSVAAQVRGERQSAEGQAARPQAAAAAAGKAGCHTNKPTAPLPSQSTPAAHLEARGRVAVGVTVTASVATFLVDLGVFCRGGKAAAGGGWMSWAAGAPKARGRWRRQAAPGAGPPRPPCRRRWASNNHRISKHIRASRRRAQQQPS